jgi:hypothetical protein
VRIKGLGLGVRNSHGPEGVMHYETKSVLHLVVEFEETYMGIGKVFNF